MKTIITIKHVCVCACVVLLSAAATSQGALVFNQTKSGAVGFPDVTPVVLTFTGAIPPVGDATLSLIATGGELNNNGKRLEQLTIDGVSYESPGGWPPGYMLPVNHLDQFADPVAPITIPMADLATYAADGEIVVSVVRPNFLAGGTFDIALTYEGTPEPASLALVGLGSLALLRRRR